MYVSEMLGIIDSCIDSCAEEMLTINRSAKNAMYFEPINVN